MMNNVIVPSKQWFGFQLFLAVALRFSMVSFLTAQDVGNDFVVKLPTAKQKSPLASFVVTLSPADAKPGDTVTLKITAELAESWHIYPLELDSDEPGMGMPTEIAFQENGLTPIDDKFVATREPDMNIEGDEFFDGEFGWTRRFQVAEGASEYSGSGTIKFQACDATKCVPPKKLAFQLGKSTQASAIPADTDASNSDDSTKLATEACRKKRPKATFSLVSLMSSRVESLVHKCEIEVEGQEVAIYLPRSKSYSIENEGEDNTLFANTATYLSIDQNDDGELDKSEAFPANLPIRILDSMFKVTDIAQDGSSLTLTKHDGPLEGAVLNRRCPEFSFQTLDGKTISNKSILGKVTILDIWAVT